MTKVYIEEVNLISFGQFENKKYSFSPGFNLIYGKNEAGKTTLANFIEGLLYGFDDGKRAKHFNEKKESYRPLRSSSYQGYGIFNLDGERIRVDRNFESGSYRVYNLDEAREVEGKKSDLDFPGKYLLGMDYPTFKSLNNSSQFKRLSLDSRKLLVDRLINLEDSGSLSISFEKALERLEKKDQDLGSSRAYTKPYGKKLRDLSICKGKINDLKTLRKSYEKDFVGLEKEREDLKRKREDLERLKTQRDRVKRHRASLNFIEEKNEEKKLDEINRELAKYPYFEGIDGAYFEKVDFLFSNLNFNGEREGKKVPLSLIFFLAAAVFFFFFTYKKPWMLFLISIPLFLFLKDKFDKREEEIEKTDKNSEIKKYLAKIGARSRVDYLNKKKEFESYQALLSEKEKIQEVLRVLSNQEKTSDIDFIEGGENIDLEALEGQIRSLEVEVNEKIDENISLERRLAGIEDRLAEEVTLTEERSYLEGQLAKIEEEKMALSLAKAAINDLQTSYAKSSKGKVVEEVNDMVRQISKDRYKRVDFDEGLNPLIERSDGSIVDLDQLSTGLVDQLNFALHFTFARELYEGEFLLFDDCMINYDDERLRHGLFFLLDEAGRSQILYFTCQEREERVFAMEEIEINKIYLEDV